MIKIVICCATASKRKKGLKLACILYLITGQTLADKIQEPTTTRHILYIEWSSELKQYLDYLSA